MASIAGSRPTLALWLKDLAEWIANPNIPMYDRRQHASANEGGVDLTSPGGTPVYALASGQVIGAGTFVHSNGNPGYGVVTTRVDVPGYGLQDLYYQHIDIAPWIKNCTGSACQGQQVSAGQLIGWVRSDVGEVETGFNAGWGGIWGENHPGQWVTYPEPLLAILAQGSSPVTPSGLGTTTLGYQTSTGQCPTYKLPFGVDTGIPDIPCTLDHWITNMVESALTSDLVKRAGLILFAVALIIVGLFVLFKD